MSRAVAEMMPAVTVPPRPNGLPIASTQSPTFALVESPQVAAGNGVFGSTLKRTILPSVTETTGPLVSPFSVTLLSKNDSSCIR